MLNRLRSGRPASGVRGSLTLVLALLCLISALTTYLPAQNAPKVRRKVLVMTEPEYPAILKQGHFQGQVRLVATVEANGNVSKVDIKGGNPMLSEYASKAVMKWKYAPGPAETVEDVVFNFSGNQ